MTISPAATADAENLRFGPLLQTALIANTNGPEGPVGVAARRALEIYRPGAHVHHLAHILFRRG